jgi:hypothetical protein
MQPLRGAKASHIGYCPYLHVCLQKIPRIAKNQARQNASSAIPREHLPIPAQAFKNSTPAKMDSGINQNFASKAGEQIPFGM